MMMTFLSDTIEADRFIYEDLHGIEENMNSRRSRLSAISEIDKNSGMVMDRSDTLQTDNNQDGSICEDESVSLSSPSTYNCNLFDSD